MTEQALEILRQGLDRLGLTYPPDAVERLALYGDRLLEKNQVMNLTAITDPCEVRGSTSWTAPLSCPARHCTGARSSTWAPAAGFPAWS